MLSMSFKEIMSGKLRTEVIWNHRNIESLWFVILQCIALSGYIVSSCWLSLQVCICWQFMICYLTLSRYIKSLWFVISACLEILRRAGWPLLSVRITFCQTGIMARSAQTGKIFHFKTIFPNCKKKFLEELLRNPWTLCLIVESCYLETVLKSRAGL